VAGDVVLLFVVLLKLAKHLRRLLELIGREMLVAHDQNVMLGEGTIKLYARLRINGLGKVEADNFGAGVIGKRRDGEGSHGRCLHAVLS
jgi:hypothetical protein